MDRNDNKLILIFSGIFFISLIYSFFLLSISMFLFGLLAVIKFEFKPFQIKVRSGFWLKMNGFINDPSWWTITLFFIIILIGGFYSDNHLYWSAKLRVKVPFLLFPVAWYILPAISKKTYQHIHYLFILIVFLSTLPVLVDIFTHFDQLTVRLKQGQPFPTPVHHVRYSMFITLSILATGILYFQKYASNFLFNRKILLGLAIYLTFFLHLLAVRTGLIALYLTVLLMLIIWGWGKIKARYLWLSLIALFSIPILSYTFIPSFKNRIDYTLEDYAKYQGANWDNYSDAERLLSLQAGWNIGKTHFWFGTGPGDLKSEIASYFLQHFKKHTGMMPHNQFIYAFAATGVLGLFVFLMAFSIPFLSSKRYQVQLLMATYSITAISFLVEHTLETSVGVAFFCFFLCLGLNYTKSLK